MGGGTPKGSSTVVQQPGPPQIAPEFAPFASQVGQVASQYLSQNPITQFAAPNALKVPGLTDMQTSALGQIQNNFTNQPTPPAQQQLNSLMPYATDVAQSQVGVQPQEQQAISSAMALPDFASQQIQLDPLRLFQYGQSQDVAGNVGQAVGATNPEQQGMNVQQMFSGGTVGESPIIDAAVQKLQNVVAPMVENKLTAAGLGRSGELGREIMDSSIGYMLPLFQQGLQQQQAGGQSLINAGQNLAGRQENAYTRQMGMQNLLDNFANQISGAQEQLGTDALNRGVSAVQNSTIPTLLNVGSSSANRQGDTINRMLSTAQAQYPTLLQEAAQQYGITQDQLNQMISGGALTRDVAGQTSQAEYSDFLRRQALSEVFSTAMLGQIPSFTAFPSTQTQSSKLPTSK